MPSPATTAAGFVFGTVECSQARYKLEVVRWEGRWLHPCPPHGPGTPAARSWLVVLFSLPGLRPVSLPHGGYETIRTAEPQAGGDAILVRLRAQRGSP
jgi:hypothetical protein